MCICFTCHKSSAFQIRNSRCRRGRVGSFEWRNNRYSAPPLHCNREPLPNGYTLNRSSSMAVNIDLLRSLQLYRTLCLRDVHCFSLSLHSVLLLLLSRRRVRYILILRLYHKTVYDWAKIVFCPQIVALCTQND